MLEEVGEQFKWHQSSKKKVNGSSENNRKKRILGRVRRSEYLSKT